MKRFVPIIAAAAALFLTACGSSSDIVYVSDFDASEYVEVCDYSEIPVEIEEVEVTEEEILSYIEDYIENSAYYGEIERTTVEEGDWINIDYTVYDEDGEEVQYAGNTGFELEVGSGTFSEGIEEALVGAESGSTVTVYVTFPESYSFEEVAGKDGYYEITINEIQEYITFEFTDEGIASMEDENFSDCEEMKAYYYDLLYEMYYEDYLDEGADLAAAYVIENSVLLSVPQKLYDYYYSDMYDYYTEYAEYYEVDIDEFMSEYVGVDEDFETYLEEAAEEYVKELLVFQYIADAEDLNPTDDEVEEWMEYYAEYYGFESVEEFEEYGGDEGSVRQSVMVSNVYDLLEERFVPAS